MDTTLVVNPGSASRKYELYNSGKLVLSVVFEHVCDGFGKCVTINGTQQRCEDIKGHVYGKSLQEFITTAISAKVITSVKDIARVGVRIVAPGTYFSEHRTVTDGYIERLKKSMDSAPLHIPPILEEIDALGTLLPHVHVVGVSDSAFHATIPLYARMYSIAREDTETFDVYRFGYHGLSVGSVVRAVTQMRTPFPARAVVCHVGSGVSVTTLKDGMSVDTTMGYSPISGLMMNTRAGDIDPGALLYLMQKKHLHPDTALKYLNEKGGLKGLLGHGDLRVALERMERGDERAKVAIRMYVHRIRKAISGAIATLGGIDVLILTATAVERNATMRELICTGFDDIGIQFNAEANERHIGGSSEWLHREGSRTEILIVHTEEMREMAMITDEIVS